MRRDCCRLSLVISNFIDLQRVASILFFRVFKQTQPLKECKFPRELVLSDLSTIFQSTKMHSLEYYLNILVFSLGNIVCRNGIVEM